MEFDITFLASLISLLCISFWVCIEMTTWNGSHDLKHHALMVETSIEWFSSSKCHSSVTQQLRAGFRASRVSSVIFILRRVRDFVSFASTHNKKMLSKKTSEKKKESYARISRVCYAEVPQKNLNLSLTRDFALLENISSGQKDAITTTEKRLKRIYV